MKVASSAVKATFLLLFWALAQLASGAEEAASLINLTGTVSAQGADGKIRLLVAGSPLWPGDVVMTESDSAAKLLFSDGARVALRASSRFMIESYRFDARDPAGENAFFRLLKGGLRTITGLVGNRGKREAYRVNSVVATIGIRGTDYALLLCLENDPACAGLEVPAALRAADGKPPAGLYLTVFQGVINAANNGGNRDFSAGRSGYVKDLETPPIELENDPGLANEFLGFHGLRELMNPIAANPEACLVQ